VGTSDIGIAVDSWIPVFSALLGVWLGYWIEQKSDERRRVRDREERKIDAQRKVVSDLQLAVDEMNHGIKNAIVVKSHPEAAEAMGLTEMPFIWRDDAPWAQQLVEAERKVRVLTSQVADAELRQQVDGYLKVVDRITDMDLTPERPAQWDHAGLELDVAAEAILNRAGSVLQSLY
jgi:hypothetical protein